MQLARPKDQSVFFFGFLLVSHSETGPLLFFLSFFYFL